MSDPKRLLEDGGPLAQEILGSAAVDRPSDEARRKAALALGIAAASAAAATTASSAAAIGGKGALGATAAASPVAPAIGVAAAAPGLITKLALALAVAGGTVGVGVVAPRLLSAPPAVVEAQPPKLPIAPAPEMAPAIQAPTPEIAEEPTPEKAETPPDRPVLRAPLKEKAPPPKAESPHESPKADLDLAGELGFIERAHAASQAGDPRAALSILDAYRQAAPHGQLLAEALKLRIEALELLHDQDGVRAAADELKHLR